MVHYKTARMFLWLTCALGLPSVFMHNVGRAQEFVSVFDGKTLDGWKANEKPESFSVVDGTLKLEGGMAHLFLIKEGFADLKNFEFKADVKTQPGANSGVFFHTENRAPAL